MSSATQNKKGNKMNAQNFRKENLTVDAIRNALTRAMTRANVTTDVDVEFCEDRSDSYADYTGVKVVCADDQIRARAVRWLAKSIQPKVNYYRELTRGQHSVYVADENTGVVLFSRWSLGD